MSMVNINELCRLCLVKDTVVLPIFESDLGSGQLYLKIRSCLPVKVEPGDKLPQKICQECGYKVELLYQFVKTSVGAEKQLLNWLGQVGELEDKQGYATEVLDSSVLKQEGTVDSRLDGSVMQVTGPSNLDINLIDNMSIITMADGSEQQFTTVPIDGSVQTVQIVTGTSADDQIVQSQVEEEEDEEEDNYDDGCDNDDSMAVKEETEEVLSERTLEPAFVSLPCDEAGPSGLQHKIPDISEMSSQTADDDPKPGPSKAPPSSTSSSTSRQRNQHRCSLCPASFTNMAKLADHLSTVHKIARPFECDVCSVSFRNPLNFARHKRLHQSDRPKYACELCNYASYQKSNLDVHMRRHAKNYTHRCDVCDKGFLQRTKYLEHRALHKAASLRDTSHECGLCGKAFNYKRNLVAHLRLCHTESCAEAALECKHCSRLLPDERSLQRHVGKSHARALGPVDKFLCDLCGSQLSSKKALAQHGRAHRGEKVAECDVCGKGFTKWDNLRVHLRTHNGEKPYLCSVCGKGFTQRTTLVYHMRGHSEDKAFKCDQCDKAFVAASILRKHVKKTHQTSVER